MTYVGTCPENVSFEKCYYKRKPWYGSIKGDHSSDSVELINTDDLEWINELGSAFVLENDGSSIPKLVWERKVNM